MEPCLQSLAAKKDSFSPKGHGKHFADESTTGRPLGNPSSHREEFTPYGSSSFFISMPLSSVYAINKVMITDFNQVVSKVSLCI